MADCCQGYQCEFIDSVPDDLYCSKCSLVAKRLTITICCGQSYCHACISDTQQQNKPCPACGQRNVKTQELIKYNQRRMGGLQVYCTMRRRGCGWSGILDHLDAHLDTSLSNCQHVDIECPLNCQKTIPKNMMEQHMAKECIKRDYVCRYCAFKSTYEVVVDTHWSECNYFPLKCPNFCGVTCERDVLEHHISMCSLEEVMCEFSNVGCDARFRREELEEHVSNNIQKHLCLMAQMNQQLQQKLQEQVEKQDVLHQAAEQKLQLKFQEQEGKLQEQKQKLQQHKLKFERQCQEQENKFQEQEQESGKIFHEQEDKLQLQERNCTKKLKEQEQKIQQQDQKFQEQEEKIERKLREQNEELQEQKQKVQQQEQKLQEYTQKFEKIFQQLELKFQEQEQKFEKKFQEQEKRFHKLLQEQDILSIRLQDKSNENEIAVREVTNFVNLKRNFTIENFSKERVEDNVADWRSPAMYTHVCGYKFCICLDDIWSDIHGKAMRVGLWTMQGENDYQLKWPAEARFTLELLNQLGGENVEYTTTKVKWVKPKMAYASKFIFGRIRLESHWAFLELSELEEFLSNDTLYFHLSNITVF